MTAEYICPEEGPCQDADTFGCPLRTWSISSGQRKTVQIETSRTVSPCCMGGRCGGKLRTTPIRNVCFIHAVGVHLYISTDHIYAFTRSILRELIISKSNDGPHTVVY
jgi:hypothetical protein